MAGYLNSHSALWGYKKDDEKGQKLILHMAMKRLLVLNDPHSLPTFELINKKYSTTIRKGWPDVTLSSMSLFSSLDTWTVHPDMDFGNHTLITSKFNLEIPKLPNRRYRTKQVSFKKFNEKLSKELHQQNSY